MVRDQFNECRLGRLLCAIRKAVEPLLQSRIVQPQRMSYRIHAMLASQLHRRLPQRLRQLRPMWLCAAKLIQLPLQLRRHAPLPKTHGAVTPLNATGKNGKPVFGGQTIGSVLETYLSDKLSPAASVVNDLYVTGSTFQGTKPTIGSEAQNLAVPLQIEGYEELEKDPNSANKLLSVLANVLGITISDTIPKPPKATAKKK